MSFLATNRHETCRIGTGCHLFGGLRFSSQNPDEAGDNAIKKYIPEHNLARFWETPFLDPHEVGFSQPVLRSTDLSDDEFNFMRPPGSHRCDQPTSRLKRRNLLTGASHVDRGDRFVPLWMVDEGTVRNRIFKLRIGFEFAHDGKPVVNMGKYYNSIAEECIASHDIVQLKVLKGHPNKIAARTMRNLELCSPELSEPHLLHNQYVDDVIQIPYMEEEIALVDRLGHVWHGKIGGSLSRVKHLDDIKTICATDCPRVLLGGDTYGVKFFDLRERQIASSHGSSLMEFDSNFPELEEMHNLNEILKVPQTVCHISPLPGLPNYTMLTTERFHYILDHRVPNQPLLEMSHSCYAGGDHVMFGATYIDRSRVLEGGRPPIVMPYYTMNIAVKPALQLWSTYFHPNINAFSSLGPPKNVQSFDAPLNYLRVHKTGRSFKDSRMGTRTFSMHHCAVGEEDAFLFRISDRGVLWYDNVTIKDRKEDKMADAEVVLEFLDEDEPPVYEKSIDPQYLRPASTAITLMDVRFDVEDSDEEEEDELNVKQTEAETGVPFNTKLCTKEETIWKFTDEDIVYEADEDRILTNIVLKMWSKVSNIVYRGEKEIVQLNGELVMSDKNAPGYDPLKTIIGEEASPKPSQSLSQPLSDGIIEALASNMPISSLAPPTEENDEYDFDVDLGY